MNIVGAIKQPRDIQTEGSNSTENWPKQHHLLTGKTRIILLVHNGSHKCVHNGHPANRGPPGVHNGHFYCSHYVLLASSG